MSTKEKVKVGTVCPNCGTVYKNNLPFAQAWGLDSWIRQGYVVELCAKCEKQKQES